LQDYQVSCFRFELDFSAGPSGISSSAVHPELSPQVSSSRELSASFGVLQPATCFPCLENLSTSDRPGSASLGVLVPHRGVSRRRPPPHGNPNPAVKFRPRRFSRPRRLPPPPAFAGLFHPAATSRVCPPGVCPSPRSRTGFLRPSHALLPLNVAACDQRPRLRLQGLAPRGECGVCRGCLDPDRSAPLLGFSSSGFSPRAPWKRLHAPCARDLSLR
jgi:hypothetical protein